MARTQSEAFKFRLPGRLTGQTWSFPSFNPLGESDDLNDWC